MSKETVQSKTLIQEAGFCSADPADYEDQVCEPEPEDYYDPFNQICSPDPVVIIEYEETKEGIEKIVRLDEKKILANQAKNFEEIPVKPERKEEAAVTAENQTEQKGEKPVPVIFQGAPIRAESIGSLIEAHEAALVQTALVRGEAVLVPRLNASASLCFHSLWEDLQTSDRARRSRQFQTEEVRDGCLEPEREPLRLSAPVFLGAALVSSDQDIRAAVIEKITVEAERGAEIDFILMGFPVASALQDLPVEENREREGEREVSVDRSAVFSPAHHSERFALAVFSASDFKAMAMPTPSRSGDLGAFYVFHFDGIPVFDHSHSVLVVLPPAWVTPRQIEGSGKPGREAGDSRHLHTKVEPGSSSQSSRDSNGGNDGRGRDSNQPRSFSDEWLTL